MSPPADPLDRVPANVDQARRLVVAVEQRLNACGLAFRPAPPVPDTCCGRGCNGCVWEGYFQALLCWREDARALLADDRRTN